MLAVRFAENAPDKQAERPTWMAQHQAHLRSGAIEILQSGPLTGDGGAPAGALLIAEVESLDDLRRFSDADPFVIHGIYGRTFIQQWHCTIG